MHSQSSNVINLMHHLAPCLVLYKAACVNQIRNADFHRGRPFLAKLSTDTWDTLLCPRNVVLQTPHRFETAAPRASMAEFRRASIEFGKLARVRTICNRKLYDKFVVKLLTAPQGL